MSPDKIPFNSSRLFFFDDVVHAIALSPCGKLLAVGGQVKAPTVFLIQEFSKAALSCATSCTVLLGHHPLTFLLLGAKARRSPFG